MKRFAVVALMTLALASCGDDESSSDEPSPPPQAAEEPAKPAEPKEDKPSGSETVATCAEETGQDTFSQGEPEPGFVACLKRLDAPPDVIAAWGG